MRLVPALRIRKMNEILLELLARCVFREALANLLGIQ